MTHQGRPWLTALTGFIALLMGFCEFYTYKIGWHPFSNPWNRVRLLHVEDIPMVLAAGAATFIVLTLLLRLLEKIPPIPERKDWRQSSRCAFCADCSISFSGMDALLSRVLSGNRNE